MFDDINKGVPQCTILGPFPFSLMVKFADDITASAPVKSGLDSASAKAEEIQNSSETNEMTFI